MTDKLYTLEEAKNVLANGTCAQIGHDLEIIVDDKQAPVAVICPRCGGGWAVVKNPVERQI
jgi:hypothetical protein